MANAVSGAISQVAPHITSTSLIIFLLIGLGFLLVLAGAGVIVYFVIRNKKFNKFVVVFEKVGSGWEVVLRTRAMLKKFGRAGDQVLLLQKGKKILPRPEIQVGRNNYWYSKREDGEWINIGLGDIDEKFREVNANFLHPEVRYQRTSIEEGMIKERYENESWWKKNWPMVAGIGVIAILCIFMFLITLKQLDVAKTNQGAANSFKEASNQIANATAHLDYLYSSSNVPHSGFVPTKSPSNGSGGLG